jgi:alginate O-acetyltransferase complex protein AlgI
MVFTSFNFLIFFPLVAVLHWLTPSKFRWLTLLLASYVFYINIKPVYALLVTGVTFSTYIFTRLIDKANRESQKKTFMIINIVLILLPLFFFKYFTAINNGIFTLLESHHLRWPLPEIKLILPIGISFYTFMAIGYTIDVYNEEIESEKHLGILALFISFFPLILSGPIERAKNMLPQFKVPRKLEYDMVVKGLKLMLWGYFMKLVVADRVGIYVDAIYNNISQHNGTTLLFASFLYPFQVYGDLGGYSLIAIGTANILGINIVQNFKRPFFATSMSEFWRRWHISLISWLTDYVYTPLSFTFRKYKVWGIVIALMITFLISGIWHGAAMTFVVWGLLQGVFLSIEALTNKRKMLFEKKYKLNKNGLYIFSGICLTYILFAASQIFGRAEQISDAINIYEKIFATSGQLFIGEYQKLIYAIIALVFLIAIEINQEFKTRSPFPFKYRLWFIDQIAYCFLLILIVSIGVFDNSQFIYFQF